MVLKPPKELNAPSKTSASHSNGTAAGLDCHFGIKSPHTNFKIPAPTRSVYYLFDFVFL